MGAKRFLRQAGKLVFANALHHLGLRKAVAAVRRMQSGGRRVVIVGYHRVVEDFTGEVQRGIPGTLISKETFARHIDEAHRSGFAFASVDEAVDVLRGRKKAKQDLFVITFDDGYREVYQHAFPLLREKGIPSIIYLPSGFIGTDRRMDHDRLFHLLKLIQERKVQPFYDALPPAAAALLSPVLSGQQDMSAALDVFLGEHPARVLTQVIDALEHQLGGGKDLVPVWGDVMDWSEVRQMASAGVEFGAHTVHHHVLTQMAMHEAEAEIVACKYELEQKLNKPVRSFSYCNGWYSDELVEMLRRHGFSSAVTTEDFLNCMGDDPFTLKRKVLWENFSRGLFGEYSSPLTACAVDDAFSALSLHHPVIGRRVQRSAPPVPSTPPKNSRSGA